MRQSYRNAESGIRIIREIRRFFSNFENLPYGK
jgi:hypothetical protein